MMALTIQMYAKIKLNGKGDISGDCSGPKSMGRNADTNSAHHDQITLLNVTGGVSQMSGSGAGGTLQPVTITKYIDKASPQIAEAAANNTAIDEVVIEYYRMDQAGGKDPKLYFKTTYTNGLILSDTHYSSQTTPGNLEDVTFSYHSVKWEHLDSSTTGSAGS
jgi:uncharacterized protein